MVPTGFRGLDSILSWRDSRPGWHIMPTLIVKTQRIFILAMQHSSIAIIWQLYAPNAPQFVLLFATWSTSSCNFTHFQSAPHCCPSPLCMDRVLLPPDQRQTSQTKKTHTANPQIPEAPIHQQHFILRTRLTPWSFFSIWKAAELLPDVLFSSVTVLLQEEKWIFVFAALGMPLVK